MKRKCKMKVKYLLIVFLFLISIASASADDDDYEIGTCPITENLQSTLFFMFMVIIAFVIISIAFLIKNGLLGTIGAILLIILSAFFYACIIAVGLVLTALGIILISLFIFKGANNFL